MKKIRKKMNEKLLVGVRGRMGYGGENGNTHRWRFHSHRVSSKNEFAIFNRKINSELLK